MFPVRCTTIGLLSWDKVEVLSHFVIYYNITSLLVHRCE